MTDEQQDARRGVSLLELKVENFSQLDSGRLAMQIDANIKKAIADLASRPGLKAERKVQIELSMKPIPDEMGALDTIALTVKTGVKTPATKSPDIGLKARKMAGKDVAVFATDS